MTPADAQVLGKEHWLAWQLGLAATAAGLLVCYIGLRCGWLQGWISTLAGM